MSRIASPASILSSALLYFHAVSLGHAAPSHEQALIASSAPAFSQEANAGAQVTSESDPSSKKKRVLHLAGGRTLRTLCFLEDGAWQIREGSHWRTLAASSVESWRDEAEIEQQARQLAAKLGPKDHGPRVEYADWLVREGFVDESMEELDHVLHFEPDFAPALELLATNGFPKVRAGNPESAPEACARLLFAAGASAGPVRRELLIRSLGDLQETAQGSQVLRSTLRLELHSPRVLRRTFAAHVLRRLLPGEEMFHLMQRCILDTSEAVRVESSRALAATEEPGIVIPLVKALGSDSRAVRSNAAESLGNAGFAAAVPSLISHFSNLPQGASNGIAKTTAHIYVGTHFAYVGDFDLEIAQGASIADPIIFQGQEAKILDARLAGISGYTYVTEYRSVYNSLKQLTGANPGSSPDDWERWYGENAERFAARGADQAE